MPDASSTFDRYLAVRLLEIGAVALSPEAPYLWASGLRAPIYCDNRLIMAEPVLRREVADGFAALIAANDWDPDVVAGTATAGIPHAAWLADRLERPMVYVRGGPKEHGRRNQIEGRLDPGSTVVLVEDLISTGGSSLAAVEALRAAGADVRAVVAVFSYGLPVARTRFAAAGVSVRTLTRFDTLLQVAVERGHLPAEALDVLRAWQADPQAWSENAPVLPGS